MLGAWGQPQDMHERVVNANRAIATGSGDVASAPVTNGGHASENPRGPCDCSQNATPIVRAIAELDHPCSRCEGPERKYQLRRKGQGGIIDVPRGLLDELKEMHRESKAVSGQTVQARGRHTDLFSKLGCLHTVLSQSVGFFRMWMTPPNQFSRLIA